MIVPPKLRRATAGGRTSRAIAAAALLALTLGAAASAQAAIVVDARSSSLNADTSGSPPTASLRTATAGSIDHSVLSQVVLPTGGGALARSSLQSDILTSQLLATGEAELALSGGESGSAQALYTLNFTLTGSYEFSGLVGFHTAGNSFLDARFDLDLIGGGSILSADETSPDIAVLLTLGPGSYRLTGQAQAQSIDPNEGGVAGFRIDLHFAELGDPPGNVPEPQTLALAMAGLLACGLSRRHRTHTLS